jgi:hypothetical protein
VRKILFLLFVLLFLQSCSFPNYYFERGNIESGLHFKEGKWLLNTVDAPYESRKKLTELAKKDFTEKLANRFSEAKNVKEFLVLPNVNLAKNPEELVRLYKTTGFNFLIDLKVKILKNEFDAVDMTNHNFKSQKSNMVAVELYIYDLEKGMIIYNKKAIGSVMLQENSNDANFTVPTEALIIGAYKKIMKDINRKSIM